MTPDENTSSSPASDPMHRYRRSQNSSSEIDRASSETSPPELMSAPASIPLEADSEPEQTAADDKKQNRSKQVDTRSDFTDAAVPVQVRIPADMLKAIKLECIAQECTMSEYVMQLLCTRQVIRPAWVAHRRDRKAG